MKSNMKTTMMKLVLSVSCFLGMALTSHALDTYFSVQRNTGTSVLVYAVGDYVDVGGSIPAYGVPTAPASDLQAPFGNGWIVDIRATVDSTYSVGQHYIGYFPGGGDCYLNIYN